MCILQKQDLNQSLNIVTVQKDEGICFIHEKVQWDQQVNHRIIPVSSSSMHRMSSFTGHVSFILCSAFTSSPTSARNQSRYNPSQHHLPASPAPHSHLRRLHSGHHQPLLAGWFRQPPTWLQVASSLSPSTCLPEESFWNTDLTMPKAAGHSTRALHSFMEAFQLSSWAVYVRPWLNPLLTSPPGLAPTPTRHA